MPKLFIGLPVYNGEDFLREAIDSIRNQTFTDWVMLISDDNSTDKTEEICLEYCKIDSRIRYMKRNKGEDAFNKFIETANCEYFMWMADDDVYYPEFLQSCINNLESNPDADMAFCNIVNIDKYSRIIRDDYPCFSRFSSKSRLINVARCLLEPEIFGRANLIMSVFRFEFFKEMWKTHPFVYTIWGFDNCFVLGCLARGNLVVDKRVLFEKRIDRPTDKPDEIERIVIKRAYKKGIFPMHEARTYLGNNLKVLENTRYYYIGVLLVIYRYLACFIFQLPKTVKLLVRYR
jgi:glycosyltransferase involved in cell wall biosynthesis